ncbi:efflux transporter periplasmic adaptor subunit [Gluconobacter oxydans]|nr:efflux transporter periplasmic adaptor subunit [Gluconobacter oxydans]
MKYLFSALLMACLTGVCHAETPIWLRPVSLTAAGQQSEKISLVPLKSGELHTLLPAMASVMANSTHSVAIRPAGSGKVTDVLVTPGEHIHKGQTLIVYTDHSLHELYLEQGQAKAALLSAQAAASEAEKAYRRGRALSGTTVSSGEVQRRLAMLQQAQATLAASQASSATITHRLEEEFTSATESIGHEEASRLISPVDGVVQSISTAVAADITAGEPVAVVTDLSTVWIVAQIRPQDAQSLAIGGRIYARLPNRPGQPLLSARTNTIDEIANPDTGLLRVISVVDKPPTDLRPGAMLDVNLEMAESAHGLIVPTAAIQQIDGHNIVYAPTDGTTFQPHEVHVVLSTDDEAIILTDLHADNKVVSDGSFSLKGASIFASSDSD